MHAANLIPAEVEQDRLSQVSELAADDPNWAENYQPGTHGCHELLDRTALVADLIEQNLQTHPACVANAEWYHLAEQAATALRDLYQRVGAEHLSAD
jgi:hypothetical protein